MKPCPICRARDPCLLQFVKPVGYAVIYCGNCLLSAPTGNSEVAAKQRWDSLAALISAAYSMKLHRLHPLKQAVMELFSVSHPAASPDDEVPSEP